MRGLAESSKCVDSVCKRRKLKVNAGKSKVMVFERRRRERKTGEEGRVLKEGMERAWKKKN